MKVVSFVKSLPPKHREALFSVVAIACIMALFITLSVLADQQETREDANSVYPKFISRLGYLVLAISREAQQTINFILDITNRTAYMNLEDVWAATNAAYSDSFQYIQDNKGLHSWPSEVLLTSGGTIMTEQGFAPLDLMRAQIKYGEVTLSSQIVRERFIEVLRLVVSLISFFAAYHKEDVDLTAFIRANAMMSISYSVLGVEDRLIRYFALAEQGDMSGALTEMKHGLVHILQFQMLEDVLLRPIMSEKEFLRFELMAATLNLDSILNRFVREVTKDQTLSTTVTIADRDSFLAVEEVLSKLTERYTELSNRKAGSSVLKPLYLVFTAISILSFLGALAEYLYYRLWDAKTSALLQANANVMHDVLVRVSEVVNEVANFSLAPQPPPKTITDQRTAIVEMELQYLIGSLKALAPSLPPLLFPQRLHQLAIHYSEVKDPATMMLTSPLRETLKAEPLKPQDAAAGSPYLLRMAERTDLQEHIHEAALLYVSVTAFHDLGTDEKKLFAMEYFQKIVSTIEECVYQYGGVMHSVSFDKVVGVWNVAGKTPNFCEDAATCGLMLANRLAMIRSQKRLVRENFPIHIGVVGGTIDVGVFGSESAKTICMFGPPLLRGMFVAQANGFHMTSVACDDYVRDAIHKIYFCKPIELIPEGGCVHEILQESNRDEPELEVQLAAYSKAFDLFERKYFKGALRAFRAYTKQYGYDSSVERIQALITGSSS